MKFVFNLKYYIGLNIEFVQTDCNYPVGKLDDITLSFLHYKSEQEAEAAWEKRKVRINYDNLFIILYDKNGLTDDDFNQLFNVKCKNLIVLSDNENPKYSFIKKIQKNNSGKDNKYFDKDKYGIMTFERQWDFVEWLNI